MFMLIILGLIIWFTYRHFAQKKRQADRRNWRVDYRDTPIRPLTRRLPYRDL
ncbi:MAG: hypothetical protein JHC92_10545 [Sphingomonadaceae bacterium]|jgi:hypothetical protein|nr:hypothetical protein [Sphingomonadaceae bacterium]